MINKFSQMINESNGSKMSLGLDIHGVINAMPSFFAFLSEAFIKNGGMVHIITGGSLTEELLNEIKGYGIKYTHTFSVYDYLIESGEPTNGEVKFEDGTFQKKFNDGVWDKVKGEYCTKHNITLHIDDTLSYNDFFKTPFARLWSHNDKPKAAHKTGKYLD